MTQAISVYINKTIFGLDTLFGFDLKLGTTGVCHYIYIYVISRSVIATIHTHFILHMYISLQSRPTNCDVAPTTRNISTHYLHSKCHQICHTGEQTTY